MAKSIVELLNWGRETLKRAGIEDYNLSAELLLRSILNLSRSEIILGLSNQASSEITLKYEELIARRAERIPLQHLTGFVEFYNVTLQSDSRALIPRPETEILVETIIEKLKRKQPPKILDIGAGSGNISIALAKNIADSKVVGVDISQDAMGLARSNAKLNQVVNQIEFIEADILDIKNLKLLGKFDCVVSNPPYVAAQDRDSLQPEVREHEPSVALFAGNDPLTFFKTIVAGISYILNIGGLLAFEVGMGQAEYVGNLMKPAFKDVTITKDLAGIERVVTGVYAGFNPK